MKPLYVRQLPTNLQEQIQEELKNKGLNQEDIDNAMDSKLTDLEDTIDIRKYL
ncbi:hypothetical protein QTG56_24855 (plasmid) [Rossellomorea sp. AcN35-11]|nr:hypothetical protein [Rossellomorea aquimaris]WJV31866.1 hypothetical protein QTG56_24855 [Rossellomorea sp. AcN35-11]